MRRTETPKPIWIKFCVVVDIPDIVTYTNFGDRRLRGFWVAVGQIFPSPIDFHRRPYNTLALPCECVIGWLGSRVISVLDSGAEGPRFKSQLQCCLVTVLGKVFTPIVHQAAKLAAALLSVAGVTAGLAESNGSLPSGL